MTNCLSLPVITANEWNELSVLYFSRISCVSRAHFTLRRDKKEKILQNAETRS